MSETPKEETIEKNVSSTEEKQEATLKDLPYMTEEELLHFIGDAEIDLTKQEIEYLQINRRRLSISEKHQTISVENSFIDKLDQFLEEKKCSSKYPYKIMILGDEEASGKESILQLFTHPELIEKYPELLEVSQFPPADIQYKVFSISESRDGQTVDSNYCLQLWMPYCTPDYASLRPLYFPATDAFVIIFSIKDMDSFETTRQYWLPEIRNFIDSNPMYKDTPIMMVGNYGEFRNDESYSGKLVPSQDVVKVAKAHGVSKYIEIFSTDTHHVCEIFKQVVLAIHHHHRTSTISVAERRQQHIAEDYFFRQLLTVPKPEGQFDQLERTFELTPLDGVEYLITLDGSDPVELSSKYTGPIKLRKPYSKVIKVVGYERGKYKSEVAVFEVPEETDPPTGYFDPISKSFHIMEDRPDCLYFMTFDGSTPTINSIRYESGGYFFDTNKPNECFSNDGKVPQLIKVMAIQKNKFRSKVASFRAYEELPEPKIFYNSVDGMFRIETIPGIVYKYTLDGSTPSLASPTYTSPMLLPKDGSIKVIKAAAFPKLYFPSRVSEVKRAPPKSPIKTKSIKMNNAALTRAISPTQSRSPIQMQDSSFYSTKSSPGYQRSVRKQRKSSDSSFKKRQLKKSPSKKEFKVNTTFNDGNTATDKTGCMVTCKAEGANVEFEFERYVYLSNVVVKTPGNGLGPIGYECFVIDEDNDEKTSIGRGTLEDKEGEQVMEIMPEFQSPCKKLLCNFKMAENQTSFKILDMKVDCVVA